MRYLIKTIIFKKTFLHPPQNLTNLFQFKPKENAAFGNIDMLVETALNPVKLPPAEAPIETETKAEHADESSYKLETFKVHESEKVNSRRSSSSSCHSEAQDKPASEVSAQFNANFKSDLDSIEKQQQQQAIMDESKSSAAKPAFIEQAQPAQKSVSTSQPAPAPTPPALKKAQQQQSRAAPPKFAQNELNLPHLIENALTQPWTAPTPNKNREEPQQQQRTGSSGGSNEEGTNQKM